MLKNERKSKIESKKIIMTEKVINLSDLLEKPNFFKNNLQNKDKFNINVPQQIIKKDKFNSEKNQKKIRYLKSFLDEDRVKITSDKVKYK